MSDTKLVNWLFQTGAVRVCPENKPFWYTSGTIGPYYINTHFLYGSEKKALELLEKIDAFKADKLSCPEKLLPLIEANYNSDRIFKGLIDSMLEFVGNNIDLESITYISGGERRDWYFSLILAKKLDKPHITIYKDLSTVITQDGQTDAAISINGANVLHIADLITEASSYERAWIPAIKNICGQLKCSVVVIDRLQGGGELLEKNDVCSFALTSIDRKFFRSALDMELINKGQYDMLLKYIANPRESMKAFLKEHPEFMEEALQSDDRTRERAQLCIDSKIYKF
ncbi:MAG: orotate phosphoribosyltransferase [Clostridiaceae bacterium]|jgi:orotate phosphoribosyltransferase|nr:orotate phosphoribosyltransferase [Clostridiaceae bacterium]